MIYLLLSVLCSTVIVLTFKFFEYYRVNTFQAIVVNYITCVLTGLPFTDMSHIGNPVDQAWFPFSILLGVIFIVIFYFVGLSAQKAGITVTSVSMKLSLAIPLTLAFFIYDEKVNALKIAGIVLALAAVVLTSIKQEQNEEDEDKEPMPMWVLFLPLLLFAFTGISDSIVQYTEITYFEDGGFEGLVLFLFGTAASIGLIVVLVQVIFFRKKIIGRSILGGIILGVPNYGSIYFFYATLVETGWETSIVFPINNIAIVATTAISAVIIFKEKLSILNIVGLICALASISLIGVAGYYA